METGRHWKTYMAKNFIGSWSLPMGADIVLTISGFELKEAWNEKTQQKEPKFSIFFAEPYDFITYVENVKEGSQTVQVRKPMGMIINATNGTMIEEMTGEKLPENWVGKRIQLGVSTIKVGGKQTDAIRVRKVASAKLDADFNEFMATILAAKSTKEAAEIMKMPKYAIFKPYTPDVQLKIKDLWARLQTASSMTPGQTSGTPPTLPQNS